MKLLAVQSSPFSCCFIPHRSKYYPKHLILSYPQVVSSFNLRVKVSNPYKTACKTVVLNNLILKLQVGDGKTKDSELHIRKHLANLISMFTTDFPQTSLHVICKIRFFVFRSPFSNKISLPLPPRPAFCMYELVPHSSYMHSPL